MGLTEKSLEYVEFPKQPDDFDWMTDQTVVVSHSPGIAVYRNKEDSVVLRQYDMGEDSFVIIRKEDVKKIAKAIVDATHG